MASTQSSAPQSDSTGKAVVDKGYRYQRITADTPLNQKMILVNRAAGNATFGVLARYPHKFFTHWAPMPTFDD